MAVKRKEVREVMYDSSRLEKRFQREPVRNWSGTGLLARLSAGHEGREVTDGPETYCEGQRSGTMVIVRLRCASGC